MAGRVPQRPRTRSVVSVPTVDDPQTARSLREIEQAVQRLQLVADRDRITADLVIGTNKVRHGLGRDVFGFTVTPTVVSAAFAFALDTANPNPRLEVWITVVGAAQPQAKIEVW